MKIQLIFSYDGSKFQGSQTQPHENGVEDALKRALSHVGIFSKITSSGRTDKDVHANNQSASVECGEHFSDLERLKSLINRHARPHINVKFIRRVSDDFQPRFDAVARSYRYVISHDEFSVFRANYELFLPKFDVKKANELLSLFIGRHDFSSFMKVGSDTKNPVREIYKAFCYEYKNKTIIVFKANGFLRAQVRLMVAAVLKGLKHKNANELIKKQLNNQAIFTRMPAPAQGLYLNRVHYF
ncbi:tRNA pseudouridine(38-40) synthase TruA [Campylobacter mucosalis]|uniref:tRNA pseudouridine(38-40) synthase TruA n=1 Tax=Campylobacter mucosalis TaxID=202 RepID=UPI0014705CE4|nr:tRNA pseudouridine(38-40) synthase TruA [Campylobacter mucosalis]